MTATREPMRSSNRLACRSVARNSATTVASSVIRPMRGPLRSTRALVPCVVEYRMCFVLCSKAATFGPPNTLSDALVMPSKRHLDRSNGVVRVLVYVKSVPSQTQMSVRVPPLSMLIRRSMRVPFT